MILGVTMDVEACFAPDYASARARFLDRAGKAGGRMKRYLNPNRGPNGEELATDTAWFGPDTAANVLILNSATHGVEGFCGSGASLDWLALDGPNRLPADTACLIVHALNPFGFAWLRRVTEEGVDLNRNCVDFTKPLPANPDYAELADAFVPKALSGPLFEESRARLEAAIAARGAAAVSAIRSRGQYSHPGGLYYGGSAPTWSRRTLEAICADNALSDRRLVSVIDYHTGLGPYGAGEPICGHAPGEPGQVRARAWYGDSLGEPMLGTSSSVPMSGLTQYGWAREIGTDKLTFIALEFGTYNPTMSAKAIAEEQSHSVYGTVDWASPQTQGVKAGLRKYFHPDTTDWKQLILFRSRQVIAQALGGMTAA